MAVISLNLSGEEEKVLREISNFEGINISNYIKKIIFERLEDEYDIKMADSAYKEFLAFQKRTTSFEDVVKELEINEL